MQSGFAARYAAAQAAEASAKKIRVGRLYLKGTDAGIDAAIDKALAKAGFQVVPLDDDFREKWEQAKKDGNVIAAAGVWISDKSIPPGCGCDRPDQNGHLRRSRQLSQRGIERRLLGERSGRIHCGRFSRNVDFIALPTLQTKAIPIPKVLKAAIFEARMLGLQNTVAVNFAGNPALAMPVPLRYLSFGRSPAMAMPMPLYYEIVPVTSLQLVGPPLSEARLLNAGRLVEKAVRPWISVKIPLVGVTIQ